MMPNGRTRRTADGGLAHSLTNAIQVLERLAAQHEPMALRDVAAAVSMPKSTVHWLLATLKAREFVTQERTTGKYAVGPMTWAIGLGAPRPARIREAARGPLGWLHDATEEAVFVTLFSEGASFLIDFIPGARAVTVARYGGLRLPAWATAAGRAALAFQASEFPLEALGQHVDMPDREPPEATEFADRLAAIRARGWEWGRDMDHAYEIAAPVFDTSRVAIGAVGVVTPARPPHESPDETLPAAVRLTSDQISGALGHGPPPATSFNLQ